MASVNPIINSFVYGELSPKLMGRADLQAYYQSASELLNMIVEFYGGAKKAPGTAFSAEAKDSSKETRIKRFVFSDTQAYIIEIGDQYMRFYMDNGQIAKTSASAWAGSTSYVVGDYATESAKIYYCLVAHTSGTFATDLGAGKWVEQDIYEIPTDYAEDEIWDLQFTQKEDVLYITHPDHPQAELTRTGHTAWTLTDIDYSVDPARPALMPSNITATTITPSAATGNGIVLTASTAIFDDDHIGSIWKVNTGYVKIITVSSGGLKTVATANVLYGGTLTGTSAYADWAEGSWSAYRGYPKTCTISEQRMVYAYTKSEPQTSWESATGAHKTFELGTDDADPTSFKTDSNMVEVINWLFPSQEILVGTEGGLHSLGTGSDSVAFTPTTARIKKRSNDGASVIPPQQIGGYVYYWQKYNRILREYAYALASDNYQTNDATAYSEHITESGIVDMDVQQAPMNILWCVRADGKLCSFTRQIEQKVAAWALHETQGSYKSVTVIPKDSYDQVWFVVERTISGSTKKYIEYMTASDFSEQEDAWFVHSGVTKDSPYAITNATTTNPVVITCVSHGFTNTDIVKIRGVLGMTELNNRKFIVSTAGANSFVIKDLDGVNIDGTAYTDYESGGEARECVDSVSGLDHLEGETVQVLVDGATHPDEVVSSGAISLNDDYGQITAGLGYTGRVTTNDLEGAPGQSNSLGRQKRVTKAHIRFYKTVGCRYGTAEQMDELDFRASSMNTDEAIPLYTGIKTVDFPDGFSNEKKVVISQDQCLPMHILSISLEAEVN